MCNNARIKITQFGPSGGPNKAHVGEKHGQFLIYYLAPAM